MNWIYLIAKLTCLIKYISDKGIYVFVFLLSSYYRVRCSFWLDLENVMPSFPQELCYFPNNFHGTQAGERWEKREPPNVRAAEKCII